MNREQARPSEQEKRLEELEAELVRYRAAERQSQASEEKYRALFEFSVDAILMIDPAIGRFTDCNHSALTFFGMSKEQILQKNLWDFSLQIQPGGRASSVVAQQYVSEAMEKGHATLEWFRRGEGGSENPVLVSLSRVTIGGQLMLMAIIKDLSAIRQQEAKTRKNEKLLQLFFTQSLTGFFLMQMDEPVEWNSNSDKEKLLDYIFSHEKVTKINQAMLDQYGSCESEFIGLTPNDLFSDDILTARNVWRDFFDTGRLHAETREQRLDGTTVIIEGDYLCLYDEQGRITGHFGVQQDITEKKQMQRREKEYIAELESARTRAELAAEELKRLNEGLEKKVEERTAELLEMNQALVQSNRLAKEASEAKSIFLANMSHEIRTPMNGVLGMAELLQYTPLDEKQKNYVQTLQHSGNALLAVINDILDYSKIEAGKMALTCEPFNMDFLLDEIVTPYRLLPKQDVALVVSKDPSLPQNLLGDPFRIRQVVSNLLNNAFKFTHKGRVTFTVDLVQRDSDHAEIRFQVADTGIGMSPDELDKLYRPFTQAGQTTARQYGGTGLGLAICHQLVGLMGGSIHVESKAGEGSAFTFHLRFKRDGEKKNEEVSTRNRVDYSQLKVLLVEDNPANQMVVKELLHKLGARVFVAVDGQVAVEKVCRDGNRFDLILMDCEMPRMDGYEATRRIRAWEQESGLAPVRICALSAHVLPEYVDRCFAAGMDAHLAKPLKFSELAHELENIAILHGYQI